MYIRKTKYPSGNIEVIVVEQIIGKIKEHATIGIVKTDYKVEDLACKGRE